MKRAPAFLAFTLAALAFAATADADPFIVRRGAALMEGGRPFRFFSVNVPNFNYIEDELAFGDHQPYALPDAFELEDVFATVEEIGGRVVRGYTIPASVEPGAPTYVRGPGAFDETSFKTLDLALATARRHHVRVILPLVNNWPWMGGRPQYAKFRGKTEDAFCADPQIIADFKKTIAFVVNRRNTVTGVRYRDDPTIMAWETGNEMTCPAAWTVDIARYLKSLDKHHLVIDGTHAVGNADGYFNPVQPHSINEDAIDIVSTHHYEGAASKMLAHLREDVARVGGKKPLLVGEFGFMPTPDMQAAMDYIASEPAIAGGLVWSLRFHRTRGGFYHHTEPDGGGVYRAYHWPGFDEGALYDERGLLALLRREAAKISGRPPPPLRAPKAPQLLPASSVELTWRGSVGAAGYDVERTFARGGPWTAIARDVDDMTAAGFPLFVDQTAPLGAPIYYRLRARNDAGVSRPSNVVGPILAHGRVFLDDATRLDRATSAHGVALKRGDYRAYNEIHTRLEGAASAELVYRMDGPIAAARIYAFEKASEKGRLSFSVSDDGAHWTPVPAARAAYPRAGGEGLGASRYDVTASPRAARRLRIEFADVAAIVRVEIDWGGAPPR